MEAATLPVGTHPGWEHDASNGGSKDSEASEDEPQAFRNVAESLVVFQSLRQSRNKWLSSAFPKFSAKARGGKPPEVVPPPHSIKSHGRFDVRIGPHIFPETTFYEVYYLPDVAAGRETSSIQALTFHAYQTPGPKQTNVLPSTAEVAVSALSSSPDVRTDFSDSTVTQDLVSQVNAAAATNPVLKDLLQLAASDNASQEQKKTLADLIRSMGAASKQAQAIPSQSPPAGMSVPGPVVNPRPSAPLRQVHDFDIVIEFQEKPSDRWIVPRGSAVCERLNTHPLSDILLSFSLGASGHSQADRPETPITLHVVSMRVSKVSLRLWELLFTWVGGEEGIAKGRDALKNIADRQPPRTYLQHKLQNGPLLEQLKNTVPPNYNMKSIMPTNSNSTRNRKKSTRKHRDAKAQVTGTMIMNIADGKHKSKSRVIEPAAPISCWSCGRADVPLLNFGRYCKNCIDTNRSKDHVVAPPQAYASSSPAITPHRASVNPPTTMAPPQAYAKSPSTVTPLQAYANTASHAYQPWSYAGYSSYTLPSTTPSSSQTTWSTKDYKRATTTSTATASVPVVAQASPKTTSSHSEPGATTHETMDLT